MDFVIVFFRDILDGPVYIVVVSICSILICSCIGYMGERYLEEQKKIKTHNDGNKIDSKVATGSQVVATKSVKEPSQLQEQENEKGQEAFTDSAKNSSANEEIENLPPISQVNYNVANIGSEELLEDD